MGVDKQPALLEVVGFQMYFIKDCCYIKKKKLYQDYILYNNKEVLFCKISDSCATLGNHHIWQTLAPVCTSYVLHSSHRGKHMFLCKINSV